MIDFKELQKKYGGLFIATTDDKVIASGTTFNEVYEKIKEKKLASKPNLSIRFIRKVVVYDEL
jgi:hypothetical protein